MLLRCCLIHITIIILKHILYLVYFCPCLVLGLFMSYLSNPFSLLLIIQPHLTHLFLVYFLENLPLFLDDKADEESK